MLERPTGCRARLVVQGRYAMTDRGEAMGRPPRAPMPRRVRRRWALAAGVAACWSVALVMTGSVVAGTALVLFAAALGTAGVLAMRAVGISAARSEERRVGK